MSITRHHNDWLRLVPNSGPFLSLPVLAQAFPQGLDAHDAEHARRLRLAFDEWDKNQLGQRPDPGLHRAWVKFVLGETLGYEELLAEGQEIPQSLKSDVAEYGETLRPDWIVNDPATKKARLLVQVYPRSQSLTKPVAASRWKTSPDTRMMQLLHDIGIRLGIVTNGDHWMLVNAPKNETTGYAAWYANLWLEEPVTLRAFRTVLGADRLFSVPENETLEALLDKSADDQQEVTNQLGYQVRKAVEVLIQALDKADQDHGRKLLAEVDEKALYESALTVMMRLVFLFCAEERELLLLGDELYDRNYAVSTLREQLRDTADQFGEEILGLRYDAWTRLLTTFRVVYAGAKHDRLKLPAYGGSLFNSDRFPFLEGRKLGTSWKNTEAMPLPVSNRTVLHLLEALQVLQTMVGKTTEARKISFRALDIEQIGHVYEGLLDHTARRATEPVLGLAGTRDKEPEIALSELETLVARGEKELLKFLKHETGRSESALKKALNAEPDDELASRFRTACQDSVLWERVKPFAGLVRLDTVDYPVVITTGSVFVTAGTDRRSSGTHYTPKSLTEPIVQYTLEPLVFVGPAEGLTKEEWKLRPAKELLNLKICDMACGSGAFLVQACRYMAARLLEAWDAVQQENPSMVRITPEGQPSTGKPGEMLIPDDPDERQTYALRIVAQRCVYGVDKNPLAAEMAKLSLWLLTLAKDMPFEFLDHAIRCGDSLVGIHNTEQLRKFNLDGKGEDNRLFLYFLDQKIEDAIALRSQITEMQANTVEEVEAQDRMLREANERLDRLKCAADMLISAEFVPGSAADKRAARDDAAIKVAVHFNDSDLATFRREAQKALGGEVTFHWPLEFPEVIVERGGFDACVGNPPFLGGIRFRAVLGAKYLGFLQSAWGAGNRADLSAYFLLRCHQFLRNDKASFGLVATNSISQGDTREFGLDHLVSSGTSITRAIPSSKWPGVATLEIARFWGWKGDWHGVSVLNGSVVAGLSSMLVESNGVAGQPCKLSSNEGLTYKGVDPMGSGFILDEEEARGLIINHQPNSHAVLPFLNGQDLYSRFDCSASRWAIYFRDWPLTRSAAPSGYDGPVASDFPDCLKLVEERVMPYRHQKTESGEYVLGKSLANKWWIYNRPRKDLYSRIKNMRRVLVRPEVSNTHAMVFLPATTLFSNVVCVFVLSEYHEFLVLQSSIHEMWARHYASSMRTDLRYTTADCFETFPFPAKRIDNSDELGSTYYEYREQIAEKSQEGLTKIYNRFNSPDCSGADIQKLRQLHVEMDNAVAAAYGWTNLNLGHGFHQTKQGVRYTISEAARREILDRLLRLNHERYAVEIEQGLHESKTKRSTANRKPNSKSASAKTSPVSTTQSLFDLDGVDPVSPATDREKWLCGLLCDLVASQPGLRATAYLDAIVIVQRPQRHSRLLVGQERKEFMALADKALTPKVRAEDSIPWQDLLDSLIDERAVRLGDGNVLLKGNRLGERRRAYSPCDAKLVHLTHKAAATLREYQALDKPNSTESQEVLAAFVADKRILCGALS